LGHHERFDGGGYPRGVPAARLPIGAQIMCVADCLDAMISDRPYRAGMGLERAIAEFRRGSGSQWNPRIVAALEPLLQRQALRAEPAVGSLAVRLTP
jgi:HD-GYP domain-containing protein (c-di-GMP phosphodiesterase class II)